MSPPLAALVAEVRSYATRHQAPPVPLECLVDEQHEPPALARFEACRVLSCLVAYLTAEADRLAGAGLDAVPQLFELVGLSARLRCAVDALGPPAPQLAPP